MNQCVSRWFVRILCRCGLLDNLHKKHENNVQRDIPNMTSHCIGKWWSMIYICVVYRQLRVRHHWFVITCVKYICNLSYPDWKYDTACNTARNNADQFWTHWRGFDKVFLARIDVFNDTRFWFLCICQKITIFMIFYSIKYRPFIFRWQILFCYNSLFVVLPLCGIYLETGSSRAF